LIHKLQKYLKPKDSAVVVFLSRCEAPGVFRMVVVPVKIDKQCVAKPDQESPGFVITGTEADILAQLSLLDAPVAADVSEKGEEPPTAKRNRKNLKPVPVAPAVVAEPEQAEDFDILKVEDVLSKAEADFGTEDSSREITNVDLVEEFSTYGTELQAPDKNISGARDGATGENPDDYLEDIL